MKNFGLIYTFLNFLKTICNHRGIIYTIACHEIKARYVGSWAGLWWSILSPLSFMFVYWFVFSIGFRIRPDGEVPFILVFLTGLIPWSLLNETLTTSVNSIVSNPHLVKKIVFPTQILPVANLLASMITHVIMLTILFVVMLANETTFRQGPGSQYKKIGTGKKGDRFQLLQIKQDSKKRASRTRKNQTHTNATGKANKTRKKRQTQKSH